jgi:hypothetical protein
MATKPPINDPLIVFWEAIEQAQLGQRVAALLHRVERINETSEQTLIRLIQERMSIAKMLQDYGVAHEQFDDSYRNNNIADELRVILYRDKK